MVGLAEEAGLLHGYLENQLFQPGLERGRQIVWARGAAAAGRPYLARAAEEHGGPHMPWFWQGDLQGGGVLNDMMCHSLEVGRHLLTAPGAPRSSIRPVSVSAQIASLKWSRPEYVQLLREMTGGSVDYRRETRRGLRARQRQLRGRVRRARSSSRRRRRGASSGLGLRLTHGAAGPGVLDVDRARSRAAPRCSSRAGCASRRARISSRSRTPSRG